LQLDRFAGLEKLGRLAPLQHYVILNEAKNLNLRHTPVDARPRSFHRFAHARKYLATKNQRPDGCASGRKCLGCLRGASLASLEAMCC